MFVDIAHIILEISGTIILVQFVMSLLISFNVINTYNDFVAGLWKALNVITDPIYRPIRRILPDFGGIDFSPAVALILIKIVDGPVLQYLVDLA
jgi:YggT family protein